jgi:actin-related protein
MIELIDNSVVWITITDLEFDWQRRYSAWVGGSMIGSLSTFQQLAIKNADMSSS